MDTQYDYAALWPELFQGLSLSTRETVLRALSKSAEAGLPPSRSDASMLVDFASGQISAREYGQRTLARITGQAESRTPEPAHQASALGVEPPPTPTPIMPEASPTPVMGHEEAALAFVRGEVTVEQYLRNARLLRSRPV